MSLHLYAVMLGGRAPRCNTELHDVVFVTGETIEATYGQCLDLWFGTAPRLHLDSYMALDVVDGHRVTLSPEPAADGKALYFVNLGGYADGLFTELHANAIVVAANAPEARARAKATLMQGGEHEIHTDDLYDVDDCLEVGEVGDETVGRWHVVLEPVDDDRAPQPVNGYHVIPKKVIAAYLERHPERA
ncbi:MAG: DUF1543 domain-containing protein [Caulobacteraceae bacterium]|nr:DUF1543 domain-containing protein [Caulobacter sp.]